MATRRASGSWISGPRLGAVAGVVTACAVAIPGCAGPVPSRARHPGYPGQGSPTTAMVMYPGQFDEADEAAAFDATRRDGDLCLRTPSPMLASDQWPEVERPSVENPWYISLPSNVNTTIFFLPPYARRRGY